MARAWRCGSGWRSTTRVARRCARARPRRRGRTAPRRSRAPRPEPCSPPPSNPTGPLSASAGAVGQQRREGTAQPRHPRDRARRGAVLKPSRCSGSRWRCQPAACTARAKSLCGPRCSYRGERSSRSGPRRPLRTTGRHGRKPSRGFRFRVKGDSASGSAASGPPATASDDTRSSAQAPNSRLLRERARMPAPTRASFRARPLRDRASGLARGVLRARAQAPHRSAGCCAASRFRSCTRRLSPASSRPARKTPSSSAKHPGSPESRPT